MPTSNFKLFDENKTNAMSDAEYASANQRLNGVQSGIASSKLQNKFQIQVSMVAYAIAQLMVQNGYDATDSTAITTFVSNLSNSVLQKVIDKATTAQAQAGTDNTKWMTPALTKASIEKIAPTVGVQIETGSYVGTGTYGQSNPNTLTFGFVPKFVWIWPKSTAYGSTAVFAGRFFVTFGRWGYYYDSTDLFISFDTMSMSGNTLTWWKLDSTKPTYQLNVSGMDYYYLAIG